MRPEFEGVHRSEFWHSCLVPDPDTGYALIMPYARNGAGLEPAPEIYSPTQRPTMSEVGHLGEIPMMPLDTRAEQPTRPRLAERRSSRSMGGQSSLNLVTPDPQDSYSPGLDRLRTPTDHYTSSRDAHTPYQDNGTPRAYYSSSSRMFDQEALETPREHRSGRRRRSRGPGTQ